jgi:DNA-binding IclR family transcriptional regulator
MAGQVGEGGVRSVQVALDVLESVAFAHEELGVTQIADRLGLTKGSVHRHLLTLVERGYLRQNPATSRYGIGPKSRVLARMAPEGDLLEIAQAPMRELRDRLGQSVVLSSLTPRGAMVEFTLLSSAPIEIGVRPGSELPFHASAQGRVLLAYAPRPFQQRILSAPLAALTDKTLVDRPALEAELARVVRDGYASAPEEAMLGINAVAAPVFDRDDATVAAIALVGSIQFLPAVPQTATIAALKECCAQISLRLGFGRPGSPGPAGRRLG